MRNIHVKNIKILSNVCSLCKLWYTLFRWLLIDPLPRQHPGGSVGGGGGGGVRRPELEAGHLQGPHSTRCSSLTVTLDFTRICGVFCYYQKKVPQNVPQKVLPKSAQKTFTQNVRPKSSPKIPPKVCLQVPGDVMHNVMPVAT